MSGWTTNVLLGTSPSHLSQSSGPKRTWTHPASPQVPYEPRGPFPFLGTLTCLVGDVGVHDGQHPGPGHILIFL